MLWCLVFCSQLAVVAFSALYYTCTENISITKESEEPKPKDGKAFTDLIEESSFLVTELPVFAFFLYESSLSHFKFLIHTEFVTALDSPPPELIFTTVLMVAPAPGIPPNIAEMLFPIP